MPPTLERPGLVWTVFAGAAAASAALILVVSRDATFSSDELPLLFRLADEPLLEAMFESPPGKYLIAIPAFAYWVLAEVFGADSYLPFRILGLVLLVTAAGLFLTLARRRIGSAPALACATLLLSLGAAWEVVAIPGRVPSQLAICAGLATLLVLERRDRAGDIAGCALGTVAVLSHPVGLAFVIASGVIVCLERPGNWKRWWVFLVPLAVYGLWHITLSEPAESDIPTTLGDALSIGWDTFVAVCATITGVFCPPWAESVDFLSGAARAVAIGAIAGIAILAVRARRVSVALLAAAAALVFDLVGPGFAPGGAGFGLRDPTAARYLYPGVVLVLLVGVEVVALRRSSGRGAIIAGTVAVLVLALGIASNVLQLERSARAYEGLSRVVDAKLGAFDLAREAREPSEAADDLGTTLDESSTFLAFVGAFNGADGAETVAIGAPAYFLISDTYGGPGDDAATILSAPPTTREEADRVLASALPARLKSAGPPPLARGCRLSEPVPAAAPASIELAAPPGRVWIKAAGVERPKVELGRLAGEPVQPIEWPKSDDGGWTSISLPVAGLGRTPWRLFAERADAAGLCPERQAGRSGTRGSPSP